VINDNGMAWFHDSGRVTREKMTYEGMLDNTFSESLNQCRDKEAVAAIYVKH
jgi:hypothetical protein